MNVTYADLMLVWIVLAVGGAVCIHRDLRARIPRARVHERSGRVTLEP